MLTNPLLILTGALVGSSGDYLSFIMCKAMNRSFVSVILGGFRSDGGTTDDDRDYGEHSEISAEEVALLLRNAKNVMITPGYGMAVAQAPYPVAGRLPGHMNVLLAEANDDFSDIDVVLVIGANDIVNPIAYELGSPIAGMPVLKVWDAEKVIVFKRSMGAGYVGVQNPLFFNRNTEMLFGDAEESVDRINSAL